MTRRRVPCLVLWAAALVSACGGSSTPSTAEAGVDTVVIGMCDPARVRPPGDYPLAEPGNCVTDSDCGDGVNGRCSLNGPYIGCTYDECFADADCPAGTRCACDVGLQDGNLCVPDHCSGCATAECGVSAGCLGPTQAAALECHTGHDRCRTNADCGRDEYCTREPQNSGDPLRWRCTSPWCFF